MQSPPSALRQVLAVLSMAVAASIAAVILGEYDLTGTVAVVAGLLHGLVLAEVELAVARRPHPATVGAGGVVVFLGLLWAVWIATNHFRNPVEVSSWLGVALGVVANVGWAWSGRSRRTAASDRSDAAATP